MGRLNGIRLVIFVIAMIASLVGMSSLHRRTSAILTSSDQLIADAKELVRLVQGIHDASSAKAVQSKVVNLASKLKNGEEQLVAEAKETDRKGGVTEQGLENLKKKVAEYQSVCHQLEREVTRIALIPDLPPDFLPSLVAAADPSRSAGPRSIPAIPDPPQAEAPAAPTSFAEAPPPATPQPPPVSQPGQPAPIAGGSTSPPSSYDVLVTRYGKEKVVRVVITNPSEIVAQINEASTAISKAAPEMLVCELTGDKVVLAPVNDFDAFCNKLDFANVVGRDDAERTVTVKIDLAKVGTFAAHAPDPQGIASVGSNTPDSAASLSTEPPSEPADNSESAKASSPEVNPFREQKAETQSDEQRQAEYSRLAKGLYSDVAFVRQSSVTSLLTVRPTDVTDPNTRKLIARGYRAAAMGDDPFQASRAIQGLVIWGGKYSVPILVELMEKDNRGALVEVYSALAEIKDPKGAEALTRQLTNRSKRENASHALEQMGDVGENALVKAISSSEVETTVAALKLLAKIGTPRCMTELEKALRSSSDEIRQAGSEAKKAIEERTKTVGDAPPSDSAKSRP
jgi:hypothetical protein